MLAVTKRCLLHNTALKTLWPDTVQNMDKLPFFGIGHIFRLIKMAKGIIKHASPQAIKKTAEHSMLTKV